MEIYEKRLDEIRPYERNPRKNEQAVEAVANSIREFGFKVPIVIDRDGTIVAGHTRYKAAQRLGLKAVPCIVADDLTPEQVKAFRLADNKTGELAEWDFPLLEKELEGLTIGMEGFGFDLDAIAEEASRIEDEATEVREDDFDPGEMDGDEEPVTEEGDLWIMGDHVLLCGDATKREDIARLMDAESEGGGLVRRGGSRGHRSAVQRCVRRRHGGRSHDQERQHGQGLVRGVPQRLLRGHVLPLEAGRGFLRVARLVHAERVLEGA